MLENGLTGEIRREKEDPVGLMPRVGKGSAAGCTSGVKGLSDRKYSVSLERLEWSRKYSNWGLRVRERAHSVTKQPH